MRSAVLWPLELVVLLIPVGMVSVLNGSIDDGYGGLIGLDVGRGRRSPPSGCVIATWFALKERSYSAVMAATGPALPRDPHRLRHGPPAAGAAVADSLRSCRPAPVPATRSLSRDVSAAASSRARRELAST